MHTKTILTTLILIVVLTLGAYAIDIYRQIRITDRLVALSEPFSHPNSSADVRILFAGDSTAVGTGTSHSQFSVAGYFHRDIPNAEIVNVAHNGAKIADVIGQIQETEGIFDIAIIQAGANDILYFTPQAAIEKDLRQLLLLAKERAHVVVLLTGGNLGLAPLFFEPLDTIYALRTREALMPIQTTAEEMGVIFVDLYFNEDDPRVETLEEYYAPDMIHLNDAGYELWYGYIRDALHEHGVFVRT